MSKVLEMKKNKVMFYLTLFVVMLSVIFHILNRGFHLMPTHGIHSGHIVELTNRKDFTHIQNMLLFLPLLFTLIGYICYKFNLNKHSISMWYTLALTFASISLISGGGGSVELHFSIFMVVAMCAYYESLKLISLMTIIFAIQHIVGLFWATELVFGVSEYTFSMILIHAIFLIFTSAATSIQIIAKRKAVEKIEKEKQLKDEQFNKLLAQTQRLTQEMEATTELIHHTSLQQNKMGNEMAAAFNEVATGMNNQNESVEVINENLELIRQLVVKNTEQTEQLKQRFELSKDIMAKGQIGIDDLKEDINHVHRTIEQTALTIEHLHQHTEKIEETMGLISQVSDQTRLLSLNASIEAAKAGDEGRGFAVVAAEIRKLSDQSKAAASEINDVLKGIIQGSEQSVTMINSGLQTTLSINHSSLHVAQGYKNMADDQLYISEMINHVTTLMNDINDKVFSIHEEMSQVAAVVQQGTAAIEQLLASVLEQESISRDMVIQVSNSNALAEQLKQEFLKLNTK